VTIPTGTEEFQIISGNTLIFSPAPSEELVCAIIEDHATLRNSSEIISILNRIQKIQPTILRKNMDCNGQMFGLFWRKAYEKNIGWYVAKKKYRELDELEQLYKDVLQNIFQPCDELYCIFARQAIHSYKMKIKAHLPSLIPELDNSPSSVIYVTKNYSCPYHIDSDEGMAYGVWLLEHSKNCSQKSEACIKNWYFTFPAFQIKIRLKNNTFMAWKAKFPHATSTGVHQILLFVSQFSMPPVKQIKKQWFMEHIFRQKQLKIVILLG